MLRPRELLPGLLVAATGVGAGDLLTAGLAGSELGTAVLWAALLGALLKGALTEGLARWQLATGTTLLEGWLTHLGRAAGLLFGLYLVLWSWVVGGALVSACGVAGTAWLPLGDGESSRIAWGVIHSLAGLALARWGTFRSFEGLMALAVGLMTLCVLGGAVALRPAPAELLAGLVPRVPPGGLAWVVGLLGGVGGTVTLLSYGYWIREHGRRGPGALATTRIDLGAAYLLTGLFGAAMVVLGARLDVAGQGDDLALAVAARLAEVLGAWARWAFLAGFWAAVFSSLLGVWQGVPYLFADLWTRLSGRPQEPEALRRGRPYRHYQLALACLPLVLLGGEVRAVQLAYAVCGALFMPFLAATLLVLNNRVAWVGRPQRSGPLANGLLLATVVFFVWQGGVRLLELLAP